MRVHWLSPGEVRFSAEPGDRIALVTRHGEIVGEPQTITPDFAPLEWGRSVTSNGRDVHWAVIDDSRRPLFVADSYIGRLVWGQTTTLTFAPLPHGWELWPQVVAP